MAIHDLCRISATGPDAQSGNDLRFQPNRQFRRPRHPLNPARRDLNRRFKNTRREKSLPLSLSRWYRQKVFGARPGMRPVDMGPHVITRNL